MTGKLLFLSFMFSSSVSWAMTPFLEPYIGISKIEATQETTFVGSTATSKSQVVNNGFHLGARVGVLLGKSYTLYGEYFQGGPYSEANVVSPSNSSSDDKLTNRMVGAGAGAHFDVISLSAAFFFKNIYDLDSSTESTTEKAVRVGLSLPVSKKQFLRANLDVFIHLLSESETVTDTSTSKVSITTTAVSLSFPFDF